MVEPRPSHDPHDRVEDLSGPFQNEGDVMIDHAAQQDDISKTQATSTAAVEVGAEHVSALLYEPGYRDPRSSPQGVEYYSAYPDSSKRGTTPAQE